MKILGIELAPLNIPLERRLQTCAVIYFEFLFLQGLSLIGFVTFISLLFTRFYWITLLYVIWYFYDLNTCHEGGRLMNWTRNWKIWQYFCQYFPMSLVKTAELNPEKNYLFGVHPHGVMSFSAFGNFSTEATGFSKIFPGLTPHLLVLKEQFVGPFMRELFLSSGACAASVRNMKYVFSNKGRCKSKGQVCVLIIGGAAESLESKIDKHTVILKNRKGFIRVALETGASLVPVYSFGENQLYKSLDNPKNSRLREFQNKIKNATNFGLPIFWGRGIFNYSFGLLPLRRPIHTVIGSPINVTKVESPTAEEINKLHDLYTSELVKLFDDHKEEYLHDKTIQ